MQMKPGLLSGNPTVRINRGLLRLQVGQDEGDGLGMLLLDKVEQVRRVRTADKVEGSDLEAGGKAVDDVHGLLTTQGLLQQFPGVIDN